MREPPLTTICTGGVWLVYVDWGQSYRLEWGVRGRRAGMPSCVDSARHLTAQWVRIVPGAGSWLLWCEMIAFLVTRWWADHRLGIVSRALVKQRCTPLAPPMAETAEGRRSCWYLYMLRGNVHRKGPEDCPNNVSVKGKGETIWCKKKRKMGNIKYNSNHYNLSFSVFIYSICYKWFNAYNITAVIKACSISWALGVTKLEMIATYTMSHLTSLYSPTTFALFFFLPAL